MFEKAFRKKLRFDSVRGKVSTEDLWDIPLTSRDDFNLDVIAKNVNKHIKTLEEESFVKTRSTESNIHVLKLDILKHIINIKINEAKSKEDLMMKKERNQKILEIIAEKQDSSLKDLTIEELEAKLKE